MRGTNDLSFAHFVFNKAISLKNDTTEPLQTVHGLSTGRRWRNLSGQRRLWSNVAPWLPLHFIDCSCRKNLIACGRKHRSVSVSCAATFRHQRWAYCNLQKIRILRKNIAIRAKSYGRILQYSSVRIFWIWNNSVIISAFRTEIFVENQ